MSLLQTKKQQASKWNSREFIRKQFRDLKGTVPKFTKETKKLQKKRFELEQRGLVRDHGGVLSCRAAKRLDLWLTDQAANAALGHDLLGGRLAVLLRLLEIAEGLLFREELLAAV